VFVDVWGLSIVFAASVAGGLVNAVVGSGTLITFPTLVALGVPPLTANITNAVGLFPGSFAGAWGYRNELRGHLGKSVKLSIAALVGAIIGALLLLVLPASVFTRIAPILIVIALILVIFGKRINRYLATRGYRPNEQAGAGLWLVTLCIAVYGGYFGAAQGVIMMGAFGIMMCGSVQHHNAVKNLLSGVSKLVAAVIFAVSASVDWKLAAIIVVGSILGGLLGASVGKKLSPAVLRAFIVVVGLIAVVKLVM
jgi:uncharacterized membrane protein YfcA